MVKVALSDRVYQSKLKAGDKRWAQLNGGFVNKEIEVIAFADAVWSGHAFTTWHDKQWRHNDNYLLGQHIGLDFDTEDDNSRLDVLSEEPFIRDNASFLYTTPSHTDDAPRCRVVFVLDQPIYQPKNYVMAATSLIWLFAGISDIVIKDAVRFFYGAGDQCDAAFPGNVLSVAKLKHIITMYKQTGTQTRRTQRRTTNGHSKREGQIDPNILLTRALEQAAVGQRNERGLWLACQLRDNGFDQGTAVNVMKDYRDLCPQTQDKYTNGEAMTSLRQAYSRPAREPWN